jgi:hypothetical protein
MGFAADLAVLEEDLGMRVKMARFLAAGKNRLVHGLGFSRRTVAADSEKPGPLGLGCTD